MATPRRSAWQARLFPGLAEPVEAAGCRAASAPFPDPFRRPPRPRVEPGELPPAAAEWADALAPAETRRAYLRDARRFLRFAAVRTDGDLASLRREDVVRWRDHLQGQLDAGELAQATARRRMAAVASLFDHLNRCCLVLVNPVRGVRRPTGRKPQAVPTVALKTLPCRVAGCPLAPSTTKYRPPYRGDGERGQLSLWREGPSPIVAASAT